MASRRKAKLKKPILSLSVGCEVGGCLAPVGQPCVGEWVVGEDGKPILVSKIHPKRREKAKAARRVELAAQRKLWKL